MTANFAFSDKTTELCYRWGGLFVFVFFGIYVPQSMVKTQTQVLQDQVNEYKLQEYELEGMRNELAFYKASYERQQFIQREVNCMAENIYFEAGVESTEGKIAVAEVVMNRKGDGTYPNTVCGVVHQRNERGCQFSWVCQPRKRIAQTEAWEDSKYIARNILISRRKYDIVGDAKYYHADYVSPAWAKTKQYISTVGNHIFYR